MFRTLRWRLTFWYGAMAVALLVLISFVPITFLLSEPSALAPDQTAEAREAAVLVDRVLAETGSPSAAVEVAQEPGTRVVVRDAGGAVLASTPDAVGLPELDPSAASYPDVQRAGPYIATRLETEGPQGVTVEAFSGPIVGGNPLIRGLLPLQAIGLLVALALMVGLGPTLATGALKPLRRVSEVAGELRRGRLESRVDLPELTKHRDEIGQVASSFDAMAESLEQLFKAERASKEGMRRFLADASHELRTPLTSVLGYLDALEEGGDRDPAIRYRAYTAMKEEGHRMTRLADDLLTLARLESRQEMPEEPVDLSPLARSVAESYARRRIEVAAPEPVVVLANPDSLRRVVANLLSNAVKHTPETGTVEVAVKRLGDEAALRVSDSGEGIPEKDLPHVFERFYRAEGSRSGGGTGLGLTIVKETVEALGGRVEAESFLGEGTAVTVLLPLADKSLPEKLSGKT